jgi:hypothetical protein
MTATVRLQPSRSAHQHDCCAERVVCVCGAVYTASLPASNAYCSFFIYLRSWSGTESTITGAIYWSSVAALDDRW